MIRGSARCLKPARSPLLSPSKTALILCVYYVPGSETVQEGELVIKDNQSTTLKNVVFSWGNATNDSGIYMVEQLTIGEDIG